MTWHFGNLSAWQGRVYQLSALRCCCLDSSRGGGIVLIIALALSMQMSTQQEDQMPVTTLRIVHGHPEMVSVDHTENCGPG